ncbi:HNH endonuclease [Neorhizobium sp. JUb45]|uniref:HNH endonuclease n=1 Tax=Neorhizobium sp. JUb45 TaxID=2485113 RepID=UPI00104CC980|nr:HNH endonuclease [Neorhizobium sp. JUb45]TCR07236.1 uncharacterized protein (TIGR02646 family) [Neorhizobium sp. JUb45]
MIKLSKLTEPTVLVTNGAAWLADLLAAGKNANDGLKSKYRHVDIKRVLTLETNGKCAYCEAKLKHVHHGDVEHIYPKSLDPKKTFKWDNLTLACELCNQNKSNDDPTAAQIIDPYITDPDDHIVFAGPVAGHCGSIPGLSTIEIIGLNRPDLIEMRTEHAEKILLIFQQLADKTIPMATRKAIYRNLKKRELSPVGAFSAMSTSIMRGLEHKLEKGIKTKS